MPSPFFSRNLAIGLSSVVASINSILFGPFIKNDVFTPSLATSSNLYGGAPKSFSNTTFDVSKFFTKIIDFDAVKKTVTVQPGVIRDELNLFLQPHGVFFGPNTSTSNRCMIGGMVGNNSSGTTSIRYGVTRDKIVSISCYLSDGSKAIFKEITSAEFIQKTKGETLENKIYKALYDELSVEANQKEIIKEFPKPEIHRRNTGYAVDLLLKSDLFGGNEPTINIGKLLCGSEGTLAFTTEVTLKVDDLQPPHNIMVVAHYNSIQESLESVVIAMKHHLYTCEMIDDIILECTKTNREQSKNRFFLHLIFLLS